MGLQWKRNVYDSFPQITLSQSRISDIWERETRTAFKATHSRALNHKTVAGLHRGSETEKIITYWRGQENLHAQNDGIAKKRRKKNTKKRSGIKGTKAGMRWVSETIRGQLGLSTEFVAKTKDSEDNLGRSLTPGLGNLDTNVHVIMLWVYT